MAAASSPLRTQCEQYLTAELARVGADGLDLRSTVARFMALGVSQTRAYSWIHAAKRDLARGKLGRLHAAEVDAAVEVAAQATMAASKEAAAVLDGVPAALRAALPEAAAIRAAAVDALVGAQDESLVLVPDAAAGVLANLQSLISTCNAVLKFSAKPDGTIKNPRMALQAAETMRKVLETALKLYESVNNLQMVEVFMREMLLEVRGLSPELARAVVERMRAVQSRWTH